MKTGKKFLVYNLKGGQGKTDIALNLALTLNFNFITNDFLSPVEVVIPDDYLIKLKPDEPCPEIPPGYNIIFDFGGFLDKRAITVLKQVDCVLVPVINDFKEAYTTINFIQEIEKFNKNIVIIANRTTKDDFKEIKNLMKEHYPDYPVFEIKESRAMPNIIDLKMSIGEMIKQYPQHRRHYKIIDNQFKKIIGEIY